MQCPKSEILHANAIPMIKDRYLEVLIEVEVTAILGLGLGLSSSVFVCLLSRCHDTSLLVITNTLLEEIGLASEGDVLHEVEWVGRLVVFLVSESKKETIRNEFNVLFHQSSVHAKKSTRKSISQELLLDFDSLGNHVLHGLLAWAMVQVGEEETCKIGVHSFVAGYELIGEGETGHETALLEPEDGSERSGEEDTLDGGESDETLGEGGVLVGNPFARPVCLFLDARDGLDSIEEICLLSLLLDICIDEKGVCFGVDVLHHDLETVEASSFWDLDFTTESLEEVLVDNSVRGSKECKNMGDEVSLVIVQSVVPVVKILGEINFLSSPERCFCLLVHLPDLMVLNWEENESIWIFLEKRFVRFLWFDC